MKNLLFRTLVLALLALVTASMYAQSPAAFNYQSIAKDPLGNVAKNRTVYVKDIIYQNAAVGGTRVWEEAHIVNTDNDGIFTINIGLGTKSPGIPINNISQIDWFKGLFFFNLKVAVAPSIPAAWWVAADNYLDMGTTQFLSSPFAMFSNNANTASFASNANIVDVSKSLPPGKINQYLITDSTGNVSWAFPEAAKSLTPGLPNQFLVTDSLGNVSWAYPQAAGQAVTNITNLQIRFSSGSGQNISIEPNTTAVVTIPYPGVQKGDPIIISPQNDTQEWQVYSSWVDSDDIIKVRFANYTDKTVRISGSQYKIVVMK